MSIALLFQNEGRQPVGVFREPGLTLLIASSAEALKRREYLFEYHAPDGPPPSKPVGLPTYETEVLVLAPGENYETTVPFTVLASRNIRVDRTLTCRPTASRLATA